MKKNQPYVKKFNEIGECTNEITKEKPFVNSAPSNRGNNKKVYIILTNMITGAYVGKVKKCGNNRKCKTGGRSKRF